MNCINLESQDPFFNLAVEENLLINSQEDFLILYINNPSVIIGKHQSAHQEVNTRFLTLNNIPVIRRISGGGTVFHDEGNLNFSIIRQSEYGKQIDFRKYTQPVIDFLISSGIQAKLEGKNDIKVDGFKISGNAEHVYRNRVLHHGTLLFSTSLQMLHDSIRKDKSCYNSRAVDSNLSPVVNLIGKLKAFSDISEFRSAVMKYFLDNNPEAVLKKLSISDMANAEALAEKKYSTWEWNYAYGPVYTFKNKLAINGLLHTCILMIKDGIVAECSIEGSEAMEAAAPKLVGKRHMFYDLLNVFTGENINISEEEIFNFF